MTTFEAHISALLGLQIKNLQTIHDGAQIVLRAKKTALEISRVRSDKGIMERHGKLNAVGEKIRSGIIK